MFCNDVSCLGVTGNIILGGHGGDSSPGHVTPTSDNSNSQPLPNSNNYHSSPPVSLSSLPKILSQITGRKTENITSAQEALNTIQQALLRKQNPTSSDQGK